LVNRGRRNKVLFARSETRPQRKKNLEGKTTAQEYKLQNKKDGRPRTAVQQP
jgi:hypothetical protein